MDPGGWVGATLAVDGGRSVVGEGCSIVISRVERGRPAPEAGGAETECSSRFICVAGGVSSALSYPGSLSATSSGLANNLFAQRFSGANSRSLRSISDSEGPDGQEEVTTDTGANG